MEQHYVGSNFVTSPAKMPGFDYWETNRLDQVGRFNDCVLFLTFDDWGNDESINKLLYVLKKHHVKATFFVLTENVDKNPNLLRAIAADGHEIASHSDSHVPLATSKKGAYHNLTAKETAAMRKDLAKSYQKLNKYFGNVQVGGKRPCLWISGRRLWKFPKRAWRQPLMWAFSTRYLATFQPMTMNRPASRSTCMI
ncbi:polysaccharide deacetylase family protein [Lactobacillus delbrueckii]|uniref:polysaccharide deacetylase family protein n=1 Tax=Lactobacillus delbrueckii TaxID=1584 RepID=UPI001E65CCEE|nr:polysaccharide deacetylase family protein [Lactobacillus delbrueckii]MCD5538168.1 polysaccharide deacetylase family protein [Lactobacillus delbrueckii subsp. lactis]